MGVLEIRPAQREGARLVIGMAGISGSGKTVSALMLAYGLANYDATKVGFIDTENRRGSLYANILQGATPPTDKPFLIGDLVAPFSPERYIEAIREFQAIGVEVLVIDSISHEHEGPGGLIEIAGDENKYWNRAKREHKKFVNVLLQSDMHIIVCVRAREKVAMVRVKDEKTGKMKTDYQDEGLQTITEKNLMFEMTASLMLTDEGTKQKRLKCPADLLHILGRESGYLTPADGKALRDWVDGAKQLNPQVEKFRNRLLSVCEQGESYINNAWGQTPVHVQQALGETFHNMIVASAKAYDAAKDMSESTSEDGSPAVAIAAAAKAGTVAKATPAKAATEQKPDPETTKEPEKTAAEAQPAAQDTAPTNVTTLRPAAQPTAAPAKELPLATPAAAKKGATLETPMF